MPWHSASWRFISLMIKNILAAIAIFVIFIVLVFVWQLGAGLKDNKKEIIGLSQLKIGERVFDIEIADDAAERSKGLSDRESLEENHGMLFLFGLPSARNFWMKNMNFPLDIIWINGDKIVGFAENVPPNNSQTPAIYSSLEAVDKVLEINAGLVQKLGIKIGDKIEL